MPCTRCKAKPLIKWILQCYEIYSSKHLGTTPLPQILTPRKGRLESRTRDPISHERHTRVRHSSARSAVTRVVRALQLNETSSETWTKNEGGIHHSLPSTAAELHFTFGRTYPARPYRDPIADRVTARMSFPLSGAVFFFAFILKPVRWRAVFTKHF